MDVDVNVVGASLVVVLAVGGEHVSTGGLGFAALESQLLSSPELSRLLRQDEQDYHRLCQLCFWFSKQDDDV